MRKVKRIDIEPDNRPHTTLGDGERCHVGTAVRIGNGAVLWDVTGWDDETGNVYLIDTATNRKRTAHRSLLVLSIPIAYA